MAGGDLPVARPVSYPAAIKPDPLDLAGLRRPDALLDFGLVLFVAVVMQFAPSLLLLTLRSEPTPDLSDMLMVVVEKGFGVLLAGGLAAYLLTRHRLAPAGFGLRLSGLLRQIGWGIAGYVAIMVAHITVSLVIGVALTLTPGAEEELERRLRFMGSLQPRGWLEISGLLILVVLHEELLFRGLLLTLLRRGLESRVWALLITSLIFGLLHFPQGAVAMGQITLVSILLGILFFCSRSLIAVMLAHFFFNFGAFQMQRLLPDLKEFIDAAPPL